MIFRRLCLHFVGELLLSSFWIGILLGVDYGLTAVWIVFDHVCGIDVC